MAGGTEQPQRYANRLLALILLGTIAVYGQLLWHQFLFSWDDYEYVVNNPAIREWTWENLRTVFSTYYVGHYAPVQMVSYMLDFTLWGGWAGGFLLTNLVVHCCNGLLVFRLLQRFHGDQLGAAIGAALFLLHPVQVESAAWISQRKTLLAFFFFLLAWEAYGRYRQSGTATRRSAYALAVLLLIFSLLAKSIAVIFPIIVWFEEFSLRPAGQRLRWVDKVPFVAAAGAVAAVAFLSQTPDGQVWGGGGGRADYHGGSPLVTFFTMLPVFCRYLGMLLWPAGLSSLYDPPLHRSIDLAVVGAAMLLAGLVVLAIRLYRHDRVSGYWPLFAGVALLPVAQIVPLVSMMNDRYLYFPMVAVAGLVCSGIIWFRSRVSLGPVPFCLLLALPLCVLAVVSAQRVAVWRDPVTLWRDTTRKSPGLARAWEGLGEACQFWSPNLYAEALQAYQRSLTLDPSSDLTRYNLGVLYCQLGQWDMAHETLAQLLQRSPQNVMGLTALGDVHLSLHEHEEAEQCYLRALRLQPDAGAILTKLGNLALVTGVADQARTYYLRIESLSGGKDPMNAYQLAKTAALAGDAGAALAWLERALQRGLQDLAAIMADESLAPVRADGRFAALIQRYVPSPATAGSTPAGRQQ